MLENILRGMYRDWCWYVLDVANRVTWLANVHSRGNDDVSFYVVATTFAHVLLLSLSLLLSILCQTHRYCMLLLELMSNEKLPTLSVFNYELFKLGFYIIVILQCTWLKSTYKDMTSSSSCNDEGRNKDWGIV